MQYINKTSTENKPKGDSIVLEFINNQWVEECSRYVNLDYHDFRSQAFKNLIIKEQQGFCCYCMREISHDNTTLEHVIPYKLQDGVNYDHYMIYDGLNHSNVILWSNDYNESIKIQPPFPHIIAYDNLVGSCDGRIPIDGMYQHCNGKRGNKPIIPLFFLNNISTLITYSKNGDILFDENFSDTIDVLNLNYQTLILIRKVWHFISLKYSDVEVVDAINNITLRSNIIDDTLLGLPIDHRHTFHNNEYWLLLSKYKWFYNYYKSN